MQHLGAVEDPRTFAREVLTPKEYEAWEAIEIRGLSIRGFARQTNLSPAAVRDRMTGARRKLAISMGEVVPDAVKQRMCDETMALGLLIARDGPICYLCREPYERSFLTIEHIIPRSRGGSDDPENLAVACGSCNGMKLDSYVSFHLLSGAPMYHPR